MFKLVSTLILQRQLSFEEGKIKLFNIPISIIPSDFIVELQKELEKRNLENIIYFAAKPVGEEWFRAMDKEYKIKTKDVMKWGPSIISLSGWGNVTVNTKKDSEKSLTVTLEKSTNAQLYGKSDNPVDHLFRGLVCGAWSYVYGEELEAIEKKCSASGNKSCEFLLMPKDKFDVSDPKINKQLCIPPI